MHELTGKCHETSIALCEKDPSLELVRGHYYCSFWGKREHWWCRNEKGEVVDPTKDQFPSRGMGIYEEFDGNCECAECGKIFKEEDGQLMGRYMCCSGECCMRLVGL